MNGHLIPIKLSNSAVILMDIQIAHLSSLPLKQPKMPILFLINVTFFYQNVHKRTKNMSKNSVLFRCKIGANDNERP